MGKQIWVKVSEPKTDRFAEHTKCVCQNLGYPGWVSSKKILVIDFLNEFDSISRDDINCSVKNVKAILSEYFNLVEIIKQQ